MKNVFALLGEVSGTKVVLDPCVHGARARAKLGLLYEEDEAPHPHARTPNPIA